MGKKRGVFVSIFNRYVAFIMVIVMCLTMSFSYQNSYVLADASVGEMINKNQQFYDDEHEYVGEKEKLYDHNLEEVINDNGSTKDEYADGHGDIAKEAYVYDDVFELIIEEDMDLENKHINDRESIEIDGLKDENISGQEGMKLDALEGIDFEDELVESGAEEDFTEVSEETEELIEDNEMLTEEDVLTPLAPQNLVLKSKTSTKVELEWTEGSDNEDISYYNIYEDNSLIKTVDAMYTSCIIENLSPYTHYIFTIKAVDIEGSISEPSNELYVTTPREKTVINSPTALFEDTVFGDLYIDNGSLNLNGYKLIVEGNLIHARGTLSINGGELIVNGDFRTQRENTNNQGDITYVGAEYAYLIMDNVDDYICVEGNFIMQACYTNNNRITGGILEVKGDFVQLTHRWGRDDFTATGSHRTIISGNGLQTVSLETQISRFNILEIKNYSDEGVEFVQSLNANVFIDNGCIVIFPRSEIVGWSLTGDQVYNGDLYLGGGVLDLNGYQLIINGNLIQSGGTVDVNGGKLHIEGDYRLQTEIEDVEGNKSYIHSNGYLKMTEEGAYVKVEGDFITHSQHSHNSYLTEGVLEVLGDFTHRIHSAQNNFRPTSNHKVVLSGENMQKVNFQNSVSSNSVINILEITNTSEGGIEFTSKVVVNGEIKETSTPITGGKNLYLGVNAEVNWEIWPYDLSIEDNRTMQNDMAIEGNFYIRNGTFNLNEKKLTIKGNLIHSRGTLNINGGELIVKGDYRIQTENVNNQGDITYGDADYAYLFMDKADGYICVEGNFITQSYFVNNNRITAGVLEVKGDFVQRTHRWNRDEFIASGSHRTILSGESLQTVTIQTPQSRFNILEIQNYSEEGIEFNQALNASTFIDNGCKIKFPGEEQLTGWKLLSDQDYDGNLYLGAGVLDLDGYVLTVHGDLIQSGGVMDINGGQLIVKGDYKIQTEIPTNDEKIYIYSNGYLKMTHEDDVVRVEGDFVTQSQYSHLDYLKEGILEVAGDFIQKIHSAQNNFRSTDNHKVVLNGDSLQRISFESSASSNSTINILEIKNTSQNGVRFTSKTVVTGEIMETLSPVQGGEYLFLGANAKVNWHVWPYDISIEENRTLQNDIEIKGSLYVHGGTLNLNKYNLTVGGNLIQAGGTININGGQLFVDGDYRIQSKNYQTDGSFSYGNSNGYIRMNNENDYVRIIGQFVTQSRYNHNGYLTSGILEVRGNFTQIRNTFTNSSIVNFRATQSHRSILSGSQLQWVSFQNPSDSGFNELVITKPLDGGGYSFNSIPVWNTLIEDVADHQPPTVPENIRVTGKTLTTITIEWDESTDNVQVEGYDIYRNGIRVGNTRTLRYIDQGLTPNTQYTYTVRAYDPSRNFSDDSEAISATTDVDDEPPTIPRNLSISSRTDTSVSLSWSASTDNAAVAGYKVLRNDTHIADTTNTRYTDSHLQPGTYVYTVKAYDASGNVSDISSSVTYDNEPPTVPQDVEVVSVTPTSVTIQWTASSDNIGVSGYRVYRNGSFIRNITQTSFTDTGLTPDETYVYTVEAYDVAGNRSGESESITVTAAVDTEPPTIPGNLRINSKTQSSITLIWNNSTDNVRVEGYNVYRDGEKIGSSNINRYTDEDVSTDNIYTYTVTAYDKAGNESEESQPLSADIKIPGTPEEIFVTAGELKVDVVWSKVDENVHRYRIYKSANGEEYQLISQLISTSYTDTNLLEGTTYTYKVTVIDSFGVEGEGIISLPVTVLPDTTPPEIISITPADGSYIGEIVRLNVVSKDNVKVKNTEFLYSKDLTEDLWISIGVTTSGVIDWDTQHVEDGIYFVKVVVTDTSNNSSEAIVSYIIDSIPPDTPVLEASPIELGITLNWELVKIPENFDHFRIYRSIHSEELESFELIARTQSTFYTDYKAPLDSASYYKVTAVNILGSESEPSNIVNVTPGRDVTPPEIIRFTPVSGSPIRGNVEISAYARDNKGVSLYSFEFRPLDVEEWTLIGEVHNATQQEVTVIWDTLAKDSDGNYIYSDGEYQIRVVVSDEAGNYSEKVHTYTLTNDPPLPPEYLYVKAGEWQMVVSWSPVLRPDFRYYVLYRKEGRDGEWKKIVERTTSNVFIDTMKDPQIEYFYKVAVVNDLGRESESTYDYSNDEIISEHIDIRSLHQASNPLILDMMPYEFFRTNSTLELETIISDPVGVSLIYEYAYLGESPYANITGDEIWHIIGEDISPRQGETLDLEDILEIIMDGDIPQVGIGENYYISSYIWDVSHLASGTYAVRASAINKGNNETSFIKRYIVDREIPLAPSNLAVMDSHSGGELHLSWERSLSDDVEKYALYRATESGGPFILVESTKGLVYRDTGLENGVIYHYVVRAVDMAGNESENSNQVSGVPSAKSDLTVTQISTSPGLPTYEREGEITALIKNLAYAKAHGNVSFYIQDNDEWSSIGSTIVEVRSMNSTEASISWIPDKNLESPVNIKVVVDTLPGTEDIDLDNNTLYSEIRLNKAPTAYIKTSEQIYSGDRLSLDGSESSDTDGRIVSYTWDLGDGAIKSGAIITHVYQIPGQYNISLAVTDNNGAVSEDAVTVKVLDNRPDLIVNDIVWEPISPDEGDQVKITAHIGNIGNGANKQGFLTGFYINNRYLGYVRVDESIEPGESVQVPFTWIAEPGVHVVKVVANDILDNLKEIDMSNNSKSIPLTTTQVNFPDVKVVDITWTSGDKVDIDSESHFGYRAAIANIGTARAERFYVSLYINGEWVAKQHVNVLDVDQTREIMFVVRPEDGKHEVTVKVDDPDPSLLELDRDNNIMSVVTPEFRVTYPQIELSGVTWLPRETILTDGTSLTFETTVRNTGDIDIINKFDVDFVVNGERIRTITIDGLSAGEEREVWTRWLARPGSHSVSVIADPLGIVTGDKDEIRVDAKVPELRMIYPDLHISDVQWSPMSIKYGEPVTFIARVSNQSVTSIFDQFNVGLYVEGEQVARKQVSGLRGHSTAIVDLTWIPQKTGDVDVKIVVDKADRIVQQPIKEGVRRSWQESFNVADALVVQVNPDPHDQSEQFMAHVYSTTDNFIPIRAIVKKASDLSRVLGPNDGISAFYTLRRDAQIIMDGEIGYDFAEGAFKGQLPVMSLESGRYRLTVEVGDGVENITLSSNIMMVQETVATVNTDKRAYQHGETVRISGQFRFRDGSPVANERIVLNLFLEPRLPFPVPAIINGKQIMKIWHAETIRFVNTDENGYFEMDFLPTTLGAGKWNVHAFAYEMGVGNVAVTDFTVWGMKASPSNLSIVSSKNSSFSRFISVENMAHAGHSLTGVSAVLVNLTPESGVRAVMDTSSLSSVITSGGKSGVMLNFNAPLDCEDIAEYQVIFSSAQGATYTSNIKLHLRPAVPMPVTEQKGVKVGVNPGGNAVKRITLTNKGLGRMDNIRLESPKDLPWIRGVNLEKTNLAPGESTSFDILINPPEGTSLGQYQDNIVVTDGKYSTTVAVGVEVSSANRGSLSFVVSDETGERVENAEVTIVGKEPYIQVIRGQEVTYYENYYGRTNSNGIVTFDNTPLGEYDYTIRARGRNRVDGTAQVMPMRDAALVEVIMEVQPVTIEWTVVPTTIEDKYDIELELTFGTNIPRPKFGFVPPWVTVAKQINETVIVEAQVINTGLVAITDVTASVLRENLSDMGISIVGGGYIGEIPAHGSARISIMIQPGYYNLKSGINRDIGLPYNAIILQGKYVSFDSDTGLPEYPPKEVMGALPMYNPGERTAVLKIKDTEEEIEVNIPEGDLFEYDYFHPIRDRKDNSGSSGGDYQIVSLKLGQTATLERQAFDATLMVSNGYPDNSLDNLEVRVTITDEEGNDVTGQNFIIPTGITGISSLDGADSLSAGDNMTATWQLIPGEGLGGQEAEGKVYLARAIVSYYVNGRYVETQTQPEEITIYPQPKIKLNYYIPGKVQSGQPFRLGVVAENMGYGEAKNLVIDSGQLSISANQPGLLTEFNILETSFGSNTGNRFRLNLGNIEPGQRTSGYWLVRWDMYEEEEGAEPFEGEFRDFRATLTHRDYKGVQLNPLIVGISTEIIGKDNLFLDDSGDDGVLSLVDVGETGFPNYLINLNTGMRLPIYVPQSLKVEKQPDGENETTLEFSVPALEEDPNKPEMPRYQVLMLKDPLPDTPIRSVTRIVDGEEEVSLSRNNVWKNNGYIYIVDETPMSQVKPEGYLNNQERYYYPASYSIDFSMGSVIEKLEYARIYYDIDPHTLQTESKYAYYDIGVHPNEGELTRVRAAVENKGTSVESGVVEFFATRLTSRGQKEVEIKIGEGRYSNLEPLHSVYVYTNWRPEQGGIYILRSSILGNDLEEAQGIEVARINYRPYADAGVDFSANVMEPVRFDGSRSYDRDGYIQSFIWEFGDGESAAGVAPVYTYRDSGTYRVKLTVIDDNFVESTSEMQITINETRPDLRVTNIELSNDKPEEGERIDVTATIYNGGYRATDESFLVSLYSNNMFRDSVRITESLKPGQSKDVTFRWLNTAGNHMLTVVANDMERLVDEADFDNNQLSRAVYTDNAFFPNLKVVDFSWDGPENGVLDWNQEVTLSAVIENDGNANADSFTGAFYVGNSLIKTVLVEELPYIKGYNAVRIEAVWRATREGVHTFKVVADGPIPRIVETDRSDNEMKIESPYVRLRYPDLEVESVSLTPELTTIQLGQPFIVNVSVANNGYADVNKSFNLSVYADDFYIGTTKIDKVDARGTALASIPWNRPMSGIETIRIVVDENNSIHEVNKKNNVFVHKFQSPLNVVLPQIVVEKIETDEWIAFGDLVSTKVRLRNTGDASINRHFTTALYVNDVLAGSFRTNSTILPGADITGVIEWKAEYLPTAPHYELTVYADVYSEIHMNDRSAAKATKYLSVQGQLKAEYRYDRNVYTVKEQPEYFVRVTSTDNLWLPLGSYDGVSANLSIYEDGDERENRNLVYSSLMDYDEVKGEFALKIDEELETGDYVINISVMQDENEVILYTTVKIVNDYIITVESEKITYKVGEDILVSGSVTTDDGIHPIEGAQVTIVIVGEEEWRMNLVTDEQGNYIQVFSVPESFGGSYSLRAQAKVEGAIKSSDSKVFYVEGLYLESILKTEVTAGYNRDLSMTLVNVGTIPLTSINISKAWENSSENISAQINGDIPESLEPGESVGFNLQISTKEESIPQTTVLKIEVSCDEGYIYASSIEVKVLEAKPRYHIEVTGLRHLIDEDDKRDKVEAAVRPGAIVTQVVSVANVGTGSIRELKITPPEKLPWISLTTSGTDLIIPVNRGVSIRDENARAIIAVHIAPNEYVKPGIYKDVIIISSNAGTATIPIEVNVGVANIGTVILGAVNEKLTPIQNATIRLIGPHTSDWDQPISEGVYSGVVVGEGLVRFQDIPSGIYTVRVNAPGHIGIEKSIEIPAIINQIPQKLIIERERISFDFDTESMLNAIRSGLKSKDDVIFKQNIMIEDNIPHLISSFPGDEVTVRGTDGIPESIGGKLTIKNFIQEENLYEEMELNNLVYQSGSFYQNQDIFGVWAEITKVDPKLPDDLFRLKYGNLSGISVNLGDFNAGDLKNIGWNFDYDNLYYKAEIEESEISGQYLVMVPKEVTEENFDAWVKGISWTYYQGELVEKVSFDEITNTYIIRVPANEDGSFTKPEGNIQKFYGKNYAFDFTVSLRGTVINENGEEEAAGLDIPVRINYSPSDAITEEVSQRNIKRIRVMSALGEEEAQEVKIFSSEFLNTICKIELLEVPETAGAAAASFGFSQDVAMVDEAFDATFTFFNPNEDVQIENGSFSLIITDKPLDENGNLIEGSRVVTDWFIIEHEGDTEKDFVEIPLIPAGSSEKINYSIKTKAGLGDISGDYFAYMKFKYSMDEEIYEGYVYSGEFTIESPPKLYISYSLNHRLGSYYELTAVVTNAGEGAARNVTVGLPSIPGVGHIEVLRIISGDGIIQSDMESLYIGEVQPGQTKAGTFEIIATGLREWNNLPSPAVRSTQVNDNMVIAPMAVQQAWISDFTNIQNEVNKLEFNIQKLMDKTIYDMAVVIVDTAEYIDESEKADRFSLALDGMSAMIDLVSTVIGIFSLTTHFASPGNSFDGSLGSYLDRVGLPQDVTSMINILEFKIWHIEMLQYFASEREVREMMGVLVEFAYDELNKDKSRREVIDLVISQIGSYPLSFVDRQKAEDILLNSSDLASIEFETMVQEMIERSEEVSIEELKARVRIELLETKRLLDMYIREITSAPSYYPIDPIYEYLHRLNNDLEYMWSMGNGEMMNMIGRYKNIWLYYPVYGDLLPYELKLDEYREPLIQSLRIQTQAYRNLSQRWSLNSQKISLVQLEHMNLPFETAALVGGVAGFMLGGFAMANSVMINQARKIMENQESILKLENERILKNLAENIMKTTALGNVTLARELSIANSVNRMFVAIDEWRKIDPPLPVEVMSIVIPDVVLEPLAEVGEGKAVLNIKNVYTGTLTIAPTLEIYNSKGLVDVPKGSSVMVEPGETVKIEIPFMVPRSTYMDAGGYTAVAFIDIAEPATMSIGETEGPYVSYFFAGTSEQINARRTLYSATQPLGRDINSGEEDSIIIRTTENTGEIRVFMAAKPGAKLELGVYDAEGNFAGNIIGAEQNDISGVVIESLINSFDYIRIINPEETEYKIVVRAPQMDRAENYVLSVVQLPHLGAVPDVSCQFIVTTSTRDAYFEVDVFESAMTQNIDSINFSISEFSSQDGYVIPAESVQFVTYSGEDIPEMIGAGEVISLLGLVEIPEGTTDGVYIGELTVTVAGNNLNPALVRQTNTISVEDSGYGWSYSHKTDEGEVYQYNMPIILIYDTTVPKTPLLYPINNPEDNSPYSISINGKTEANSGIIIWANDMLYSIIESDDEGDFDTHITLSRGSHKIYVTKVNNYGEQSEPSQEYTVVVKGRETTPPEEKPTPESLLEVTLVGDGLVKLNDTTLPANYKNNFEHGTSIALTAIEGTNSKFAYWEDIKTKSIVSYDTVYEFIMGSGRNIKAVFNRVPQEDTDEFTVVFLNRSGMILKSTNVNKGESAIPPSVPAMVGYTFTGWDKDYSNVVSDMIIYPVFKRLSNRYTVNVEGGMLSSGKTSGEYQFDLSVSVIAHESEEGKKFSHWLQDGIRVSTTNEFSFFMPKRDTIITAVYVDEIENIDATPFMALSEHVLIDADEKTMIFTAIRNITEEYTLVESGVILFKSLTEFEGELTLETENIIRGRIKNNSTDQFYVRKLNIEENDIWYGRAYMIYKDIDGRIITVYSENTAIGIIEAN
ncbi:UNVERIFIED_CONTAM: fibronectin type III domain protein [Acetivibrio alkalicellulosi]